MRWIPLVTAALAALPAAAGAQDAFPPAPPPDTLAAACSAESHREFDFWLGRWSVGPPGQPPRAVNEITRIAQGCALLESYHNGGGYTGTSINYYDAGSGSWHQLWVDNGGLRLHLSGGLDAEGRMVMRGERADPDGGRIQDRITWVPLPDGRVRQIWDVSRDGGATWENTFTGEYAPLR